jgi:class 3 adenylate cyclase
MPQEPPSRVERRLSAILAADVAGYSRLMHNDEESTHAKLTALLTDAVKPSNRRTWRPRREEHRGWVFGGISERG